MHSRRLIRFNLDGQPRIRVEYGAGQQEALSKPLYKWAKAYTLDNSFERQPVSRGGVDLNRIVAPVPRRS